MGLAIVAAGAAVDVGYHLVSDAPGAGDGVVAFVGHLVTVTGMVVTLLGLFGVALKRYPVRAKTTTEGDLR